MRIAYVTETFLPSVDGVVTRMTRALDWLAEQGHEVSIIAPDLGCREYRSFPVVGVRTVTYPVYRSRPWGTPSPQVARELSRLSPELIHVWQPSLVGLPAVLHARRHRVPLVTSYHTNIASYLEYYGPLLRSLRRPVMAFQRWLHNASPLTLVTSQAMRRHLEQEGFAGPVVLPRGVELAARDPRFASAEMRARLSGGHPERPLLVYVGRVAVEKGLPALEPLMRAHPEWSLAIVGGGPQLDRLQQLFEGTNTTFTGFLQGEELSAAFASGDVFVFPSTTETLGLVILEAQASGVPVMAAASPATDEQIRPHENGLTYDPTTPGALEAAVSEALAGGDARERMRVAGLAEARENDWAHASAALYACYERTLALYEGGWQAPRHPMRRVSSAADDSARTGATRTAPAQTEARDPEGAPRKGAR